MSVAMAEQEGGEVSGSGEEAADQGAAEDGGQGEDEGFEVCARLFHEDVSLKD